ncbi:hypothetical protein Y1Q_0024031 [Alligator mississippiensis]|uniref:Reverse transcriptase zinc-binding domain-containing protein n=1 Tax=Alligator mississippiensis TaxID=8496 RepID=A0A151NHH4_ALLMI|nr:hypothetical protein Y1Q_0024031 [Alligator mississippiensis]
MSYSAASILVLICPNVLRNPFLSGETRPWIRDLPWFYETLNQCCNVYGLQNVGLATMKTHRKIQETERQMDTTLPMDLLLSNACQAVWECIHHKELCKDHRDLNWLIAHRALLLRAWRHRKEQLGRPSCPWPNKTIEHLLWLCTCAKEVWKRVQKLGEVVTSVSQLTSETALYGHLTKHQGSPSLRFGQFASCVRSALWKARNLLLYRQTDIEVVGCMKMVLSELQTYYQKSVAKDGEDTANATWHRDTWHKTIQPPPSEEGSESSGEEEQTSGTEDSDSDNGSSSGSSSGSWSNDRENL